MRCEARLFGGRVRSARSARSTFRGTGACAKALLLGTCGQSTVEYLLVTLAFLVPTLVLAAVWRQASGGGLMRGALDAASHGLGAGGLVAALQDVLLY